MTTVAFKATYSDWKLIKTRGVVQVVMEVPLSEVDAAYQILGGMPDFGQERWFAIAPLKQEKEVMPHSREPSGFTTGPDKSQPQSEALDKPQPAGAKRTASGKAASQSRMDWRELQPAAQAGIRCADPVFRKFLEEKYRFHSVNSEGAAEGVRTICAVASRSELGTNHKARVIWKQLDDQFQAWQRIGA